MKLKAYLFALLLLPLTVCGQRTIKIFYDVEWKVTDSTNAAYYRFATFDANWRPLDSVKDYYMSGEKEGSGIAIIIDTANDHKSKWRGTRFKYYKSGAVKARFNYNKDGQPDSINRTYYESGKLKMDATFKNGAIAGKFFREWDEFGNGTKVFSDFFHEGNVYDWPVNMNEKHDCRIVKDTGLEMTTLGNERGVAQAINLPLEQNKWYSIETKVDFKGGADTAWHGIIWGFKDWNNFHFFYINAAGYCRGGTIMEGIANFLLRDTYTDDINKGVAGNVLKVIMTRKRMVFSINGRIVNKTEIYPLFGNYTGFMLGRGKQQAIFRNLVVNQVLDTNETLSDSATGGQNPFDHGITNGNPLPPGWGNGSGFFIDTAGYVVTNCHVVKKATQIEVMMIQNGDRVVYKAKVISEDQQNDLAVIKITDEKFKHLSALPYNLKTETSDVATDVFALGFPQADYLGAEVKFTDGKISSKTGYQGNPVWYQVSVPIQPGNSGGPLFDYDGNIIGITNAEVRGDQNVDYAIKSSYLKSFLESLPEKFDLPHDKSLAPKPLTEKIKVLTNYVVMVLVK